MTIEQEFFEAFNYKPQIIVKYELDDGIFELEKSEYLELLKRSPINGKYVNYISEIEVYPPITPEIVLKLEEIIFNLNCNVELNRSLKTHKNKERPYEGINGEVEYHTECHFEWLYVIFDLGDYFESEDKTYNDWRICSQNKDRKTALLNILKELVMNNNVLIDKEELQDQVKALFNA